MIKKLITSILIFILTITVYIVCLSITSFIIIIFDLGGLGGLAIWFLVPALTLYINKHLYKHVFKTTSLILMPLALFINIFIVVGISCLLYKPPEPGDIIPDTTFIVFPPSAIFAFLVSGAYYISKSFDLSVFIQ